MTDKSYSHKDIKLDMRHILKYSLVVILFASCSASYDEKAAAMLAQSRAALAQKQYAAAKDTILSMRVRYPEAIEARKQGILLLDSIEMEAAADSMLNATGNEWERLQVKKQFFERKLQEDKKR